MKNIDLEKETINSPLGNLLIEMFAKKTGISKDFFKNEFEKIIKKESEYLGKSMSKKQNINSSQIDAFKDLSVEEYLQSDKIIKDK